MSKIEYNEVNDALRRLSLTMDGAELQGTFCGRLMSGAGEDEGAWIRELIGERDSANLQAREDVSLVARVFGEVLRQLNDVELQFELLLPEEESLAVRTEALAAWCEGFLYGYGVAAAAGSLGKSEVEQEFIRDLMAISRASFPDEEESEEDEMDFMQVVEHVRIGAMLLYEESRPVPPPPTESIH